MRKREINFVHKEICEGTMCLWQLKVIIFICCNEVNFEKEVETCYHIMLPVNIHFLSLC